MNLLDPLAWSALLIVLGCVLIVMEVFIPSGGVLCFLACASVVASIVMAFTHHGMLTGFGFVTVAFVSVTTSVILALKYLPQTPIGRRILLGLPTEDEVLPTDERKTLIGKFGVVKSPMLPSGAIVIEGRTIDAVSQGMAIDPGQRVLVVEVKSNRVVVRPAEADERPADDGAEDLLSRPLDELGLDSLSEPLS
jgi:membrane-bound serine protease (ClpP class)